MRGKYIGGSRRGGGGAARGEERLVVVTRMVRPPRGDGDVGKVGAVP